MIVLPNALLETCANNLGGMGGMESVGDGSGSLLIDDFEDGDNRIWGNGLSGHWESHSDLKDCPEDDDACLALGTQTPLGGRHNPEEDWTDGAFSAGYMSTNAAHFTGSGFEGWGSGQALYFAEDEDGSECLYDASAFAGITFWAKGSVALSFPEDDDKLPQLIEHNLLKVHVVERGAVPNEIGGECDQEVYDCWDSHRVRLTLSDCWQKFVLPFDELTRDGWSKWNSGELDVDKLYQLVFEVSGHQTYDIEIDDIMFYTAEDVPEPVMGCD